MRPSSCVTTYHVAAVLQSLKFELKVVLLNDIFIANTNPDPIQIINIDSEPKCLEVIRK